MVKKFGFLCLAVFFPCLGHAVVMRHDVASESYNVSEIPRYIVAMPYEGHGVLIDPQWVVSVAHLIFYNYAGKHLKIDSKQYEIEDVILHPNYREPDKSLFSGDAEPLMNFLKRRSDLALIKLAEPVSLEIKTIDIYDGKSEKDKIVTVYGNGATGDGIVGENIASKALKVMKSFNNTIDGAEGNWLTYTFNTPPDALALEGMHGSGDSGGPSIITLNGKKFLVGLSSWQYWHGDIKKFKGGLYETVAYQVRLSSYKDWINSVIKGTNTSAQPAATVSAD